MKFQDMQNNQRAFGAHRHLHLKCSRNPYGIHFVYFAHRKCFRRCLVIEVTLVDFEMFGWHCLGFVSMRQYSLEKEFIEQNSCKVYLFVVIIAYQNMM